MFSIDIAVKIGVIRSRAGKNLCQAEAYAGLSSASTDPAAVRQLMIILTKNSEQITPSTVAIELCLGGLKGGKARIAQLSPEERRELARKAVQARWAKEKERKQKP